MGSESTFVPSGGARGDGPSHLRPLCVFQGALGHSISKIFALQGEVGDLEDFELPSRRPKQKTKPPKKKPRLQQLP